MATDEKLTALTEDTNPSGLDLAYTVKDPDGVPLSRVARWSAIVMIAAEYGTKPVWDAVDGYHIEAGLRNVDGEPLEWSASITRSSLSLSNSAFYYVYLYDNSGTPAVEESTTVPTYETTYRTYQKTGDSTRRCIGCFRTDGSGNIYRFVNTPLGDSTFDFVYYSGANSSPPFVIISGTGSSSAWSTVDLTGMCPAVIATSWYCAAKIVFANDGDDGILSVQPMDLGAGIAAGPGAYTVRNAIGKASAKTFFGREWIQIETDLTSYYRTHNVTGIITADVEIHGFRFVI